MKNHLPALIAASILLTAASLPAQTSGTSHPETLDDSITAASPQPPASKPSPAVPYAAPAPMLHAHDAGDTASVPTDSTLVSASTQPSPASSASSLGATQALDQASPAVIADDIDSGIVLDVPSPENEVPEGTFIRVALDSDISTETTLRGAPFRAQLTQDIVRHGKVVVPAGTTLSGQISQIHGGHRISGAATIYLEPEFLTLPDGTNYRLDAQVIDLTPHRTTHVSEEGAIVGNDHGTGTLAALGLTTASAASAGAVIGGAPGALIGAGIGAGVSTVWWLKHENQQTLPKGTEIVFSLNRPMLLQNATN